MKKLVICGLFFGSALLAGGEPTDNPVAAFYDGPEGYPAWTDAIAWSRVINLKTYAKGKNDFEKFENARDELAGQGGGVLYYPAGTYDFRDAPSDGPNGRGLMLRSGIVIRGEAPAGKPNAVTDQGKLEPPAKFVFGFRKKSVTEDGKQKEVETPRDWNLIGLMPEPGKRLKDVNRVGICWVHLAGAVVYWGPDLKWGPSWKEGKSWKSAYAKEKWAERKPDGTHPADPFMGAPAPKDGGGYAGVGEGRLVFGCVLERAALLNDYDTCGRAESKAGFGEEGFHMAKFAARLSVYGSRVFIANNSLPKSPAGNFRYEQTTVRTAPGAGGGNSFRILDTRKSLIQWDYGRVMGLDVNKDMLSMVRDEVLAKGEGGYFEEGVTIIDNWVWNHGHKGFNLSGNWGLVRNNRNERTFQKGGNDIYGLGGGWRLTLDGFIESCAGGGGMISDNLARAFDMSGRNLWIDGNSFHNTGSNPGNDGEGILCQAHGGTHVWSWAVTRNVNEGSSGGNGKGLMGGFNVDCLGLLVAWNKTEGYTGTLYRKPNNICDCAFVANQSSGPGSGVDKVEGDGQEPPLLKDPEAAPAAPKDVKAAVYQGDAVMVNWTDGGDGEVAFRVQRRIEGGPWRTIAYRPPHRKGDEKNPQAWADFLAPSEKKLEYRVVAVNSRDQDTAAGAPTGPLTLPRPK